VEGSGKRGSGERMVQVFTTRKNGDGPWKGSVLNCTTCAALSRNISTFNCKIMMDFIQRERENK